MKLLLSKEDKKGFRFIIIQGHHEKD